MTELLKRITDSDLVKEFTQKQARFTNQMDQDSEDSDDSNLGQESELAEEILQN